MIKVYVVYQDQDNSCLDKDCCGGPFPYPSVKVFSTIRRAKEAGHKEDELTEVELNSNEFVGVE